MSRKLWAFFIRHHAVFLAVLIFAATEQGSGGAC